MQLVRNMLGFLFSCLSFYCICIILHNRCGQPVFQHFETLNHFANQLVQWFIVLKSSVSLINTTNSAVVTTSGQQYNLNKPTATFIPERLTHSHSRFLPVMQLWVLIIYRFEFGYKMRVSVSWISELRNHEIQHWWPLLLSECSYSQVKFWREVPGYVHLIQPTTRLE